MTRTDRPGWFDWQDLYDAAIARAEDGARFVETGTFFGRSTRYLGERIAASGKRIIAHSWDDWRGAPPEGGYPGWTGREVLDEAEVRAALADLPVLIRTGDALNAAGLYRARSLDLVFLDDKHDTDHVAAECAAWWAKVRPGGLLAGHDYDWPIVRDGVHRWAADVGVEVQPMSVRSWGVWR